MQCQGLMCPAATDAASGYVQPNSAVVDPVRVRWYAKAYGKSFAEALIASSCSDGMADLATCLGQRADRRAAPEWRRQA